MRVLLIDDDDALAAILTQQLTEQHYVVDRVADGEEGWAYGSTFDYDLVVLDWMLPKLDGIRLCQRFRQQGFTMPILLLTAKDHRSDKIKGLESGADDYMVKPFDVEELIARLRALSRRGHPEAAPLLCWGELCLDPVSCAVSYQERPVSLTAKEYALLELFLRNSHRVFNASNLLDRVWSSEEFPSEATVRSHIRGLRRKLKAGGAPGDLIETVHGRGYRLKSPENPPQNRPNTESVAPSPTADSPEAPLSDRQARYLAGLTQAWSAHKGESIARWQKLEQAAAQLTPQGIRAQERDHLQHLAHSLAGTLGTFGLLEGYRLAIQIEHLLQLDDRFSLANISQFKTLVAALGHALDESPSLGCPSPAPPAESPEVAAPSRPERDRPSHPSLLIVDINDIPYTQQLMALAIAQGYETCLATSIEVARQALQLPLSGLSPQHSEPCSFDSVLLNLVCNQYDTPLDESFLQQLLQLIEQVAQQWPNLPVVIVTPQADFGNRLDLVRRGGCVVLEYPVVPSDVLEIVSQSTHYSTRARKIMIVDDDTHYLQHITQQLKPWDFQITPLANPRRFWSLFSEVVPDLVMLDIEMPHINGLELCQVLRSDPQWQHLPVVFVSVHGDRATQEKAFALGADDYITKPIQGNDLARRLNNRLQRYQASVRWQVE